jgi:general secretion pathway protein N
MNTVDQRRVTPVLATACVLLVLATIATLMGWGGGVHWSSRVAVATTVKHARHPPPSTTPLPLEHYAIVWQHPLFQSDRRPAAVRPDTPQTDPGALKDLALTGVILTPSLRTALLREHDSGKVLRVREGETIPGGWTLQTLAPRSATFVGGGQRIELSLSVSGGGVTTGATPMAKPVTIPDVPNPARKHAQRVQAKRIQSLKDRIEQRRRQVRAAHGGH